MAQPTHRYILEWSRMITPHIIHLCFTREDKQPLPFVAGQFITLHIEDPTNPGKKLHRSYSIANIPAQDNTIEMACAYVENGRATNLLFNLKPGDSIEASGPYGLFVLKEEQPTRYILVATGTGVTPYRSMLHNIQKRLAADPNLSIMVIQGVRNQAELLFGDDFMALATAEPRFQFKVCYSRPENPEKLVSPTECKGYVQELFTELNLDPQSDIVYLCGNPNMIDDAFAKLSAQGFDRKAIRREKYLFAH